MRRKKYLPFVQTGLGTSTTPKNVPLQLIGRLTKVTGAVHKDQLVINKKKF